MTLLEISSALQDALKSAVEEESKLEKAKLLLLPLEESSKKAHDEVNRLISEFQRMTGANISTTGTSRRKRSNYTMSAEKKVEALYRRTMTRAEKAGLSLKDARKKAEAISDALRVKLGLTK
jgi:hypothetical protein